MSFIRWCCERGAKSHRKGTKKKPWRKRQSQILTNILQLFSISFFFSITLLYHFFSIPFYPRHLPTPTPTTSERKNVLPKPLRIPYRRLKAGFFVCWPCSMVCLFTVTERVLAESEWNAQGVNVCFSKSLFTFVWFFFFVTWKLLWTQNNRC